MPVQVDFKRVQSGVRIDENLIRYLSERSYIKSSAAMTPEEKATATYLFPHHMMKLDDGTWRVLDGGLVGRGSFGVVIRSKTAVKVQDGRLHIKPIEQVAKIQLSNNEELFAQAKAEAEKQQQQGVKVFGVKLISDANVVVTVTEDCGVNLQEYFETLSWRDSFRWRLQIAASIVNEMFRLEQMGIVHRDLKPANICIKVLPNGSFRVFIIDFGIAETVESDGNYDFAGTPAFIAPEVWRSKPSTHSSDIYALAGILGQLFGAKDIFKNKSKDKTKGFCFDGLFEGFECDHVDKLLQHEIRYLFESIQHENPKLRPTLAVIAKFFILITVRQAGQPAFDKALQQVKEALVSLNRIHQALKSCDHKNPFAQPMVQKLKSLSDQIDLKLIPLLSLASEAVEKNIGVGEIAVFPDVKGILSQLNAEYQSIGSSLDRFKEFAAGLVKLKSFEGTNSSGAKQMLKILASSKLTELEKLNKLQMLGREKTKKGMKLWYSQSHFFGRGRQHDMHEFYVKLAAIDPSKEYFAIQQLRDVFVYASTHQFAHKR